jgi:hypothetical protein
MLSPGCSPSALPPSILTHGHHARARDRHPGFVAQVDRCWALVHRAAQDATNWGGGPQQ